MKYSELPAPNPNHVLSNGVILEAPQPLLYCPLCHTHFSANPGDYWNCREEEATCAECEAPLALGHERTVIVPYGALGEWEDMMEALYDAYDKSEKD